MKQEQAQGGGGGVGGAAAETLWENDMSRRKGHHTLTKLCERAAVMQQQTCSTTRIYDMEVTN